MKKVKLLSLFLAGTLLFQAAGIDAMATAPSDPAPISETVDDTDTSPEQPVEEENGPNETTEEETDPNQPSVEEGEKDPVLEEENPDLPSEGEEEKAPGPEEENPDLASEEEGEKDPVLGEENPSLPSGDEADKAPVGEDAENKDSISENTVSENSISENTLPEDEISLFSIFPGLGDDYQFSSQQLADKRILASHVGDVVKIRSMASAEITDFTDTEGEYRPDEVMYLAETKEEAEQVAEAFGGTLDSFSYEVAVISLPEEATVSLAIAAAADPDIKLPAVWPNYYQYLYEDTTSTVNTLDPPDPGFDKQWQHDYIGTRYAWAAGFKGQGVNVAVIDTGLAMDHEDLSANAVTGRNFVNKAGGTAHTADNQTHGTHVAGIIAADDNGKGGIGIAPDATVRGYCVFPESGGAATSDVLSAINAAAADGNDIINMSLGSAHYSKLYEDVVKKVYEENGVAIFAASGNEDTDGYAFPAAFASTISIGAVNENGTRASFSNYGKSVTLSFPGVNIYSTVNKEKNDGSYIPDSGNADYGLMSGTSMACPTAAGTAAVILSARPDIRGKSGKARVDALLTAMKSSTTKCATSGMGAGTTYLPGVLKLATDMTVPDAPEITIAETPVDRAGKTYMTDAVTVTLSTKTAVGVDIYYSTDGKTPVYKNGAITNAAQHAENTPNAEDPYVYTLGDTIKLTGERSKTIKAIAVNPISGKVSKVASKTVILTPVPTGVTVTPAGNVTKIAAGKTLKFTAAVTPSYAVSNRVAWTVVDSNGQDAKAKGVTVANGTVKTSSTKTVRTPAGTYKVIATPVGSDGKTFNGTPGEFTFTVIEAANIKKIAFLDAATNRAPKTKSIKTTDSKTADAEDREIDLKTYLNVTKTDPVSKTDTVFSGADAAKEVVWSSSNIKVATVSNGVIHAVSPGKATIKATSNDGGNRSASYTVTVVQPVTGITIGGPTDVAAGKTAALTAKVSPANASNKKLEWTVSGDGSVSINKSNGRISTKRGASGTYTITARAADKLGAAATYTVSITDQEITEIKLSANRLTMFPLKTNVNSNTTATLTATVKGKPAGSSARPEVINTSLITWTSSAPSIASVDQSGKITARAPGRAAITCAAADGSNKKAVCSVTVSVPMSKLVIGPTDGNEGDVAVGKNIKMAAKYYSNYGTPNNKKITWRIYGVSDETLSGKVSINKTNGSVSVDKSAAPTAGSYVGVQAVAQDGSGVTSNIYPVYVRPNYIAAQIDFMPKSNSYSGYFYIVATAYKDAKGKPDWSMAEPVPDYCTATVSGSKNSGLLKQTIKQNGQYYALYQPVPSEYTSLALDDDPSAIAQLRVKDLARMKLTIKLKDGSNLTARENSIYAIRYAKGRETVIGYFDLK